MSTASKQPEGTQKEAVPDTASNWAETRAPHWARPWLRLSRADRPIGTWLLLLPCWWSLFFAMVHTGKGSFFDLWIFVACALGAFLMRGAGCTWNDITDRHIDGSVERTRLRPIPSGQVTVKGALTWAIAQSLISFAILLTFNGPAISLGVLALLPVAIYPFAKRFTWWPQVFLGLAFNWGALLAWTAHTGSLGLAPVIMYIAGIAWTLFYDTIYAHQDTEDDALIGVKSTARLFGARSPQMLRLFAVLAVALLALSALLAAAPAGLGAQLMLLAGVGAFGLHLAWQLKIFNPNSAAVLLRLFRANRDAGLILVLFSAVALVL